MALYPLVPLGAAVVCAALASALFLRPGGGLAARLGAALISCVAFWAACEVVWGQQSEPAAALAWVRISALGWVWLPPLALHLFLELTHDPAPRARRALPLAYAGSALFLALALSTPWTHSGVVRTSWGWSYTMGPAYPFYYVLAVGTVVSAVAIGARAVRRSAAPAERAQARLLIVGIGVPLVVASLTDGLLPLAGYHPPHLGTASFVVLAVLIFWSFHRYGYSLLAPGDFAREILETLDDGVGLLRVDGRVHSGNAALARLLGVEPDALPGLRLTERVEGAATSGSADARPVELRPLSGDRRPVAVSTRELRDRRGSPIGHVWVLRDLDELVRLRDRLLLSERLAAVGELAAGIAHEIANPLTFVRANLGVLRQHWDTMGDLLAAAGAKPGAADLLAEGEELFDETREGVDRAAAIVRDVRGLAHGGRHERRAADPNELVEGVLRMAAPQLRDRIRIERCLADVPPVWGAPQELQQVLLNLVLNAAQAVAGAGRIRVTTERRGESVVVCVEDDGCGIAPEIRHRIFDPFFTTKAVGEGSGLGLGIAHGIVRRHGGDIEVESEPGRGTRFSVHLPVAADTLDPA